MTVVIICTEDYGFHYKGETRTVEMVEEIRTAYQKHSVELVHTKTWSEFVNLDHDRIIILP